MSGNQKFMQIQNQIRNNTYSVRDYVSELSDWTEEIQEKDRNTKSGKNVKVSNKNLPPIRSVKLEHERMKYSKHGSYLDTLQKKPEQPKVDTSEDANPNDVNDFKRDNNPMPNYYK